MTNNITKVEMWKTEDGQVFESEEGAAIGAARLSFIAWHYDQEPLGDPYHEVDAHSLLDWLVENKEKVLSVYGDLK